MIDEEALKVQMEIDGKEKIEKEKLNNIRIKLKFDLKERIEAGVLKIKSDEDFLYEQYHQYCHEEKFNDTYNDPNPANNKEKEDAFNTSTQLLNYNYDVTTVVKSLNAFSFLNYKIVFNEAQYNIFNYLCKQTFLGEYMIGFPIDNFVSKIYDKQVFDENLNNFQRSLRCFRKNLKFCPYDSKIIKLFGYFSSNISTNKFSNNLRSYYKLIEELMEYEKENSKKKKKK